MTPREIDLLVQAFRAFLGADTGVRFLLTNRSMQFMIEEYGRRLSLVGNQEGLLQHIIDHGADERNKLLGEAALATRSSGETLPVLSETSFNSLRNRKPPNHDGF